jgi:class 3 adenylate cyclase/predicted ATPase
LPQYLAAFEENDIDAETLALLDDGDLRELGVTSLGHRKKLKAAIGNLNAGTESALPAASATTATSPEGDRRPVTALFADISGFTTLSGTLDPEQTHELLNTYFRWVDAIIESFGGRIDKHIGDGVMAVFGAPVAHDNDPERAVRAALAVHRAMPDLSVELGREITVHIGVASGEVVASRTGSEQHAEYTVTGDTVNLSARLEGLSGSRETLISAAAVRATQGLFATESRGAVELQGFDQPIEVWLVLGEAADVTGDTREALPFVGRRAELQQLGSLFDYVKSSGRPHIGYLRGEAGIGKSALVRAAIASASDSGFQCHATQLSDFGDTAHGDVLALLARAVVGPNGSRGDAILSDLLGQELTIEQRASLSAMDAVARRNARRQTLFAVLSARAAEAPILVVVEDLHWAPRAAIDDLAALIAMAGETAMAVLLATRIDGDPMTPAWCQAIDAAPLTTIDLRPLTSDEARELAAHTLNVSREMAEQFVSRAEGNPLFLGQMLREVDVMASDGLPTSIQSLVLSRLDRLPAIDRTALQGASALGQTLDLSALRHVMDAPAYEVDVLERHYLMHLDSDRLRFPHALIRDSVYASLLGPTRRSLHERAADWYRTTDPSLHALHLDRADNLEAADAYCQAGHHEAGRTQYVQARENFQRGLEIATNDTNRHALSRALGDLSIWQVDVEAAEDHFKQALASAPDETARCRALVGLAGAARQALQAEAGRTYLDAALKIAEALALTRQLAQIHQLSGSFHFSAGEIDACLQAQTTALEFAHQAEDPELDAQSFGGLGDALYAAGRMRSALESLASCLKLAREHGFGRIEVAHRVIHGTTRRYLNQFSEAIGDFRGAIEMSEQVASRRSTMVASLILGEMLMENRELEEAKPALERALEIARSLNNNAMATYTLIHIARREILGGDKPAARSILETAQEPFAKIAPAFIGAQLYGTMALATETEGDRRAALKRGREILEGGSIAHNHLWYYRDAMESALEASEWGEARDHADRLEAFTRAEPLPWADLLIERGRLLSRRGECPTGRSIATELTQLHDRIQTIGWRALL